LRQYPPLSPRRLAAVSLPAKPLLCAAVVAAALLGGLARPVAASASPHCWQTLLTDWYDGRIDHTYPLHCYTDALKHLPPDVQTYSSAHDDILRALQNAKAKLKKSGLVVGPNTQIPPSSGGRSGKGPGGRAGGGTTTKGGDTSTSTPTAVLRPTKPLPGHRTKGGLTSLADKLNPSSPSSLPLPLLVLGALAILLVAAGAAGLLAKRIQGRRPGP
jgi:hypothetical protein